MLFNLIALALLGLAQAQDSSVGTETDCRNIPNFPINYTALAAASPLLLLRTNNPSLNCTTGLLTGPVTSQYYFMLIRQGVVTNSFSVNSQTDETQSSPLYTCSDNSEYDYKFLQSTLSLNTSGVATTDPAYFIAYLCGADGKISLVKAYAPSESFGQQLQDKISATLGGITGATPQEVQNVQDASFNCTTSPSCGSFFS